MAQLVLSRINKVYLIVQEKNTNEIDLPVPCRNIEVRKHHFHDWVDLYGKYVDQMLDYILDNITANENFIVSKAHTSILRDTLAKFVYQTSSNKSKDYKFLK
jgi:hypothetical protein